jgi:hypothetical protein
MRTRTRGIQLADDGRRIVNKEYKGQRIFQRLGNVSQNDAEAWLSGRQAEIDAERANSLRRGGQRLWADAARKRDRVRYARRYVGAPRRNRTFNLLIKSQLLCQLS